jgi:hypothetical protein
LLYREEATERASPLCATSLSEVGCNVCRRKQRRERMKESREREASTVVPKLVVGPHVRSPEKVGTNLIKHVRNLEKRYVSI